MIKKFHCEICEKDIDIIYLINHHICSRSKNGSNEKSNIATICRNCHEDVHHGLIIIEGRFNSTHGNIVVYRDWSEQSVTGVKDPEIWLYPNAKIKYLKVK